MALKTLTIRGDANAGKKTLAGHLLLNCGANLPEIELIEKRQVRDPRDITAVLRRQGKPLTCYGPSSQYSITEENASSADVLLWVVDATSEDRGASSCIRLKSILSSGELKADGQLIVVVNKMDLNDWSEGILTDMAQAFSKNAVDSFRTSIVPLSSLQGKNILETPKEVAWLPGLATQDQAPVCVVAQPLLSLL